ncbi:MAG: hypothetical protein ACO1SV_12215 [Fimbriimonas sp.]
MSDAIYVPSTDPREPYIGRWAPDLAQKRRMMAVACEYAGRAWSPWHSRNGILAYDGEVILRGGATVGANAATGTMLHPTGSGLFATTMAPKASVAYSSKTGAFTLGERVTQATSGAIGYVVRDEGNVLTLQVHTGTFFGTHTVTGVTSGQSAFVASVATAANLVRFIERSTNGFANFVPVFETRDTYEGSGFLPRQMLDCGVRTETIFGTPNTRLILYFEYGMATEDMLSRIVACQPDVDPWNWRTLMSVQLVDGRLTGRHFHGGIHNLDYDTVVVFVGDTDDQSAILTCEDVADLCNRPEVWAERWAMNLEGAERVAYLTTGDGAPYCAGAGSQKWRTVDMVLSADGRKGRWVSDNSGEALNVVHEFDFATRRTRSGRDRVTGIGWLGLRTSDGTTLISAESDYGMHQADEWNGNSDGYVRIYAVDPRSLRIQEVWRGRRKDSANPVYPSVAYLAGLTEFRGIVWGWDYSDALVGGDAVGHVTRGAGTYEFRNSTGNLEWQSGSYVEDGRGTEFNDYVNWLWQGSRLDVNLMDVVTVDTLGGSISGRRTQGAAAVEGAAYAQYRFDQLTLYALRGRWVTFRVRLFAPTTLPPGQIPALAIVTDGGETSVRTLPERNRSDAWQALTVSAWVPTNAISLALQLVNRTDGLYTGVVRFADVSLVEGTIPAAAGIPARSLAHRRINTQNSGNSYTLTGNRAMAEIDLRYETWSFYGTLGSGAVLTCPANVTPPSMPWYVYNWSNQPLTFRMSAGQTGGVTIAAGRGGQIQYAKDATGTYMIVRRGPDVDPLT